VESSCSDLHGVVTRMLARAVADSGKSHSEIARLAGMKRNSVQRSLMGSRTPSLVEVVAILDASGVCGQQTLMFALLGGEELAFSGLGSGAGAFLEELFKRTPAELLAQLGENVDDLRPRWANGTAKMLARTLTQHIADLNRRGDAVGERT
jgi:antitoxin HigA-1